MGTLEGTHVKHKASVSILGEACQYRNDWFVLIGSNKLFNMLWQDKSNPALRLATRAGKICNGLPARYYPLPVRSASKVAA